MTQPLIIRVLGPLVIERAGTPVSMGSPMQRRLLAALVMADGATVSTERLIDSLWGNAPPASARNSLQTYIARLREALGAPSTIVTRPPGYALDVETATIDVREFERSRRSEGDRPPLDVAAELRAALSWWHGRAYDEFADEDLARSESLRLAELRRDTVVRLAQARLDLGETAAAIEVLRPLHAAEPLQESVVIALATILASAGRIPDALDVVRHHRTALSDELGLDVSSAITELEGRVLRGEVPPAGGSPVPPTAAAAPDHNQRASSVSRPPRGHGELLGRDELLATVRGTLQAGRLVTLTGPGGVGKTTLAAAVADGPGDVWVDLAPVSDEKDVAVAVAESLGLAAMPGVDLARVVSSELAAVEGTVVLDNCEHLLTAVAALADHILTRHGPSRLLATSRERLDVPGEHVVAVHPLPVPSPDDAAADDPAVQLFRDRVVAAGGGEIAVSDAAAVVAAVDGLPLALELAAARAATLPITALLERQDLDLLSGTSRRGGRRHRSLSDVIAWSHDLLSAEEQVVFRRLSVFADRFDLPEAEAVCHDDDLAVEAIAPAVARLVETSMIERLGPWFRLLVPLRVDARTRMRDAGDEDASLDRHRDAVLDLAERAKDAMATADEQTVAEEVTRALPDIRAVQARADDAGDLRTVALLTGRLHRYAYLQGRPEILHWGSALVDVDAADDLPRATLALAIAGAATAAWMAGNVTRAADLARRAQELEPEDPADRAVLAEARGDAELGLGDLEAAGTAYAEQSRLAATTGRPGLMAMGEIGQALVHAARGELAEARRLLTIAADHAAESGSPGVRSFAEYTTGELLADHEPDAALAAFESAMRIAAGAGMRFCEGIARTGDVALRSRHGDPMEALERYESALRLWRDVGADGLVLTTLRNLVVLLGRVAADHDALVVHAITRRLADKPSYGVEHTRIRRAVVSAEQRVGVAGVAAAEHEADRALDLASASDVALAAVRRARGVES